MRVCDCRHPLRCMLKRSFRNRPYGAPSSVHHGHVTAGATLARTAGVTDCTRVSHGAPAFIHRPTYAIPRAQPAHHFIRAHPRYSFTNAGKAWKPSPTGYPHLTHVAPTPQSRRDAPRQLPFQGSRGVGRGLRRLRIRLPRCRYRGFPPARKGRRPRRPVVAGLPGLVRRIRSA